MHGLPLKTTPAQVSFVGSTERILWKSQYVGILKNERIKPTTSNARNKDGLSNVQKIEDVERIPANQRTRGYCIYMNGLLSSSQDFCSILSEPSQNTCRERLSLQGFRSTRSSCVRKRLEVDLHKGPTAPPPRHAAYETSVKLQHRRRADSSNVASLDPCADSETAVISRHAALRPHTGRHNIDFRLRKRHPWYSVRSPVCSLSSRMEPRGGRDLTLEVRPRGRVRISLEPTRKIPYRQSHEIERLGTRLEALIKWRQSYERPSVRCHLSGAETGTKRLQEQEHK